MMLLRLPQVQLFIVSKDWGSATSREMQPGVSMCAILVCPAGGASTSLYPEGPRACMYELAQLQACSAPNRTWMVLGERVPAVNVHQCTCLQLACPAWQAQVGPGTTHECTVSSTHSSKCMDSRRGWH